jgi:hypothetical protein
MKPEFIVATPATHVPHLADEESYGLNVLKGYSNGLMAFGTGPEIYEGLSVKSWGYEYFSIPSEDLFIFCQSWVNFKVAKEFTPAWETWLAHHFPKNN